MKPFSCTAAASAESRARCSPAGLAAKACPWRPCQSASRSSSSNPGSRARLRSAAAARARLAAVADALALAPSCRSVTDLTSVSRLSSWVRILMASVTALISSDRVALLRSQFLSRSLQVPCRFCRNFTSADRCFRVMSRSSLASARAFWLDASSSSSASSFSLPSSTCSPLVSASSAWAWPSVASVAWISLSSDWKSSSICSRTPKIPLDLGL
mmetsp:Transcript_70421/g.199687  ORF Transcript_70421/g.199687 Transcript_70421/m.199687 type:complete len:214 (-) Transcript_70421:922-1563(-)